MKNYRVQAISRISRVGHGARSSWAPPAYGGAYFRPGGTVGAVGGPSSNPITDAINAFQAGALEAAMVGLGALLLATALLILISQTSAGAAAGSVCKGAARRGLRAIPGVGILA